VGYDVIGDLLHQHIALQIAIVLLAVKAVMWVVALGSGTSGGVLAPLLMLGAGLGTVLSHWLPGNEPALWPLVCMAATLGATLGAPLTAIVFAFGLTHDSNALLPLLTATLVAHGFATVTMRRSIMTEKIARRGYHIYREYGVDPLERHHVDEVMTASVDSIDADMTVGAVLDTFFGAKQTRRAYPVVREGAVIGVADRALLEQFRDENPDLRSAMNVDSVFDRRSAVFALPTETCRLVATRLAVHSLERLPVVADSKSMRLIGIVSRSDLVKPSLTYFEEEHKKERFRRLTLTRTKRRFAPIGKAG
jgi:CBS domain-containing protein